MIQFLHYKLIAPGELSVRFLGEAMRSAGTHGASKQRSHSSKNFSISFMSAFLSKILIKAPSAKF